MRALREAEERKIAEEEARRRASREVDRARRARGRRERASARKTTAASTTKRSKHKADEVAKKRFGGEDEATPRAGTRRTPGARSRGRRSAAHVRRGPAARRARAAAAASADARRADREKQRGRLTLVTALNADEVRERSVASFRRRTQRAQRRMLSDEPKEKLIREVTIPGGDHHPGARQPHGRARASTSSGS